jgi:putative membrane fusion protein
MAKKKNINFKPFVMIFILIIALIIGIQIFGAARFESILAAQGEVIDGFWSEVLIVRDETLIKSPLTGRVKLLAGEGDRLASGRELALIKSSDQQQKIYNRKAGIVSFAVDGLEAEVNLANLDQINLNNFNNLQGDYKHLLSGDKIKKDEALYRVINNFKLYLVVEVPEAQSERFNIGELIFLEERNADNLYEAKITNIRHNLDKIFFQIKVKQFIPQWINRRRIELNIIKNIYRGIKIPRKSVFSQLSGQGILKVTGYNKYEFQKVLILNGNEDFVIVSGLEIGEEIITNPEDFDYGREA